MAAAAPDFAAFRQALTSARHVVVLTGAGVSAESGIPTFRGAGGLWRKYDAAALATPAAFSRRPSLVWEFYHWRREVAAGCRPNAAHFALAALERKLESEGRRLTVITQLVDRLSQAAGSRSVLELHGSIWDVCRAGRGALKAGPCWEDRRQPLVPALAGRGAPDADGLPDIPLELLPHDDQGRLLRPGVVWFGESLDAAVLEKAQAAVADCELFMTAGTSSVVYPAAGFAHQAATAGVPVAEFNLEDSGASNLCTYVFRGKAGELLPAALGVEAEVAEMMAAAAAAAQRPPACP